MKNYYEFGSWVFNCLDIHNPKEKMGDVIEIVEIINPDSYEELAEVIIKNSLLFDSNDYEKNKTIFSEIIKYMILSFNENNIEIFNDKIKLIEFVVERKN